MKVYFVRHGESIFNIEKRHQFPDTPLSEKGRKQASAIAQRFTTIPIDIVITSTYARALETAKTIEKIKSTQLVRSDLFIERKLPTQFHGKLVNNPEIAPIHQKLREHFDDPIWHFADEENFSDLLARAKKALDFIHSQEKENVVVVTHGYFLNVMIYLILFGEQGEHQAFIHMKNRIEYSNTGLTLCEHKDDQWKLLTLNDYAHLGE